MNVETKLLKVISEQFNEDVADIQLTDGPGDLDAWDSIGQLQLIVKVEKEFNIKLSVDDVVSIDDISDMISLIENKIEELPTTEAEISKPVVDYFEIRLNKHLLIGHGGIGELYSIYNINRLFILVGNLKSNKAESLLRDINISGEIEIFEKKGGEPTEKEISRIAKQLKAFQPDFVLAIGGGSVMDSAKLAWALYENDVESIDSLHSDGMVLNAKARLGVLPTLFGSGSEISSAAAYSKDNSMGKSIVVNHDFIPEFVNLDYSQVLTAPEEIIFFSAFDALTHAIEGYCSIVPNFVMKNLAIRSIKLILMSLKSTNRIKDKEVLESILIGSYWAGQVQNHCSVGLSHSIAHQLEKYQISHGKANSLALVDVLRLNSTKTSIINDLAHDLGFIDSDHFISNIEKIIEDSGFNISVKSDEWNLDSIVEGAMKDVTFRTNPVVLEASDVRQVLMSIINRYEEK